MYLQFYFCDLNSENVNIRVNENYNAYHFTHFSNMIKLASSQSLDAYKFAQSNLKPCMEVIASH